MASLRSYEVWARDVAGIWKRVTDDEIAPDGVYEKRDEAEEVAEDTSEEDDVIEVVVVERTPILRLNGKGIERNKPDAPKKPFISNG